mgnify:CR=1 FL=1
MLTLDSKRIISLISFLGVFFFQAEDGIRDLVRSRGLGDVYKRQVTAKACILAVPARMMERQRIAIKPGLPATLHQAFAEVTMGLSLIHI